MSGILTANDVWRDHVTVGVPASGANEPDKREIRGWATALEVDVATAVETTALVFTTRTALLADLAHGENTRAEVRADPDPALNGIYVKSGASGSGTWTRIADLPDGLVTLVVTGGTASAIEATATPQLPSQKGRKLYLLTVSETNPGAVTLAVDDDDPVALKNVMGDALVGGELLPGVPLGLVWSVDHFRLWVASTIESDDILAAVVAARNEAVAAAAALGDINIIPLTFDGATTSFNLGYSPASAAGLLVMVGGVPQLRTAYTIVGSTLTFSEAPPEGTGEVRDFGVALSAGTPGNETVGAAQINGDEADAIRVKIEAVLGPQSSPGPADLNLVRWVGSGGEEIGDAGVAVSTDGTLASNSDAKVPTEKAVKTYADTKQPLDSLLTNIADLGNGDTGEYIQSDGAGDVIWGPMPGLVITRPVTVDFNDDNSDWPITVKLPTGFTRYRVFIGTISHASASLTTATCGVFTAAAGGGTAVVASGTALTVSTASESTNNNMQSLAAVNGSTTSFIETTLYFRVQTPQGSAATADVTLFLFPLP